jgi:hypothetical protein
MRDVGERTLEHLHSGPHPTIHVNNEFAAEWYPRWRDGYADLKKYSDMGQLLFSPEASVLLAEVRNGLGRIQDPWGMGDEERAAAELKVLGPAMESLKTFAQKDLDAASLSRSRWSLTKH